MNFHSFPLGSRSFDKELVTDGKNKAWREKILSVNKSSRL